MSPSLLFDGGSIAHNTNGGEKMEELLATMISVASYRNVKLE
jgi:hypothetical protein